RCRVRGNAESDYGSAIARGWDGEIIVSCRDRRDGPSEAMLYRAFRTSSAYSQVMPGSGLAIHATTSHGRVRSVIGLLRSKGAKSPRPDRRTFSRMAESAAYNPIWCCP